MIYKLPIWIQNKIKLTDHQYWTLKVSTNSKFDILLVGSSRVYRGLSPLEMRKKIKNKKIYNFGFSACVLDSRLLTHARGLLSLSGDAKGMLIAITPHCFILRDDIKNGYYLALDRKVNEKIIVDTILKSQKTKEIIWGAHGVDNSWWHDLGMYKQRFYVDGWVATKAVKWDPMDYVRRLSYVFNKYSVNHTLMRDFFVMVDRMIEAGIKIWGFRPPTNGAMVHLENEKTGFDYDKFKKRFESVSGIWINVSQEKFSAFDGSHIDMDQALILSREIAGKIRETWSKTK